MAGRPRQFDVDKALLRARDLFWANGFEGVSMSDLVQALGIASARIYAAFGSKEELFRRVVILYEEGEGGFADRALNSSATVWEALYQTLMNAIALYTTKHEKRPLGCLVVTSAANCTPANASIGKWLQEHRRQRTNSFIQRFQKAVETGELPQSTDAESLGDLFATFLHGLSIQARDGVSRERLTACAERQLAALRGCVGEWSASSRATKPSLRQGIRAAHKKSENRVQAGSRP